MVPEVKVLLEGAGFPHLRASVVLVQTSQHRWLIDSGGRSEREALLQALARCNLSPAAVDALLFTHLHYDHCDNLDLFPHATLHVHEREWAEVEAFAALPSEEQVLRRARTHYAVMHPVYQRFVARWVLSGDCRDLSRKKNVRLLRGTTVLDEGFTAIDSPGHSIGHLSARICSAPMVWVAGDSVSSEAEYRAPSRTAMGICWDLRERERSLAAIGSHTGWVVPGHGAPFWVDLASSHRVGALDSANSAEESQRIGGTSERILRSWT